MRGQVLGVDVRTGDGLIAGDDGARYTFTPGDWADRGEPSVGGKVDFEPDQRQARNIFPLETPLRVPASAAAPAVANDRNKIVAAVLAFFFGTLGIHRFYLGRTGSDFVMLALSITVVGLLLAAPWALIDAVRYLIMRDAEFAARYARR